ncbi:tetraspanin-2A-like isoform X1 [Eriocheir sinensis]|uniref:tetraspanin-2A-like isoform X1 n=1 Tax=Eriocheir sinensis TaxID=95602 RepID=UPI0021C6BF8F|nr:tetraspanin-2A-like isoform X1 [Eriocheir sinensis]XP_050728971.1 tetraspanin-2A-like isoform X1 [Eriocheir sinensis]
MARGKGSATSGWDEHHELLQYLLYIFNTVFFCGGALVFAIGLWIRFDHDMNDFIEGLSLYHYWNGTTVVIVGAVLVMLNCFLACCGAYFSSRPMIIVYIIMTFITFVMLIAGSAYVLANGLESSNVYPYIQKTMRELIYRYQWDVAARRSVDIIQEYVGCCGGYSSSDFTDIHLPVPNTCRDQVTGNQYGDSCAEIFAQYLEVRTGWLTGLSLCLCFFQCFAVMISICMYMAIRERDEMKRDRM